MSAIQVIEDLKSLLLATSSIRVIGVMQKKFQPLDIRYDALEALKRDHADRPLSMWSSTIRWQIRRSMSPEARPGGSPSILFILFFFKTCINLYKRDRP